MIAPLTARQRGLARVISLALAFGLFISSSFASAAADPRELKAREEFAAGRYEGALDMFAKLYAETLHPVYLRNIGRCYQNLGQPDRAITSFREYLHKAKNMTPDERVEVDGYIADMEALKTKQEASSAAAPARAPVPAAVPPPEPTGTAAVVVTSAPPLAPVETSSPVYERWWFWTIVVGVAVAGVGGAAAAGAFTHTSNAACPAGFTCPR